MASVKKEPPKPAAKDEMAETGEAAAFDDTAPAGSASPPIVDEIPSRAAKRAGKSSFVVVALGAVKFGGRFHGPGATLDLTEEEAADLGPSVEPKKDAAK